MKLELHEGVNLADALDIAGAAPADQIRQYEAFVGPWDAWRVAHAAAYTPLSWTLTQEDRPLAVGGFVMVRSGVYQDWLLTTADAWAPGTWKAVTRQLRLVSDRVLQAGAHRLQCVALADRDSARAWYRVMRLEYEGTLRAYGLQGQDAVMYSRVVK